MEYSGVFRVTNARGIGPSSVPGEELHIKDEQAESWQPALTKSIARVEEGLAQCLDRYQAIPQRWGNLVVPSQGTNQTATEHSHRELSTSPGCTAASLKRRAGQRADPKHFKQLGQRMETLRGESPQLYGSKHSGARDTAYRAREAGAR